MNRRLILNIVAVLALLVGLLWTLQGSNVLGGSVMSGKSQWLYAGVALLVVSLGLFVWTNRRR